MYEGKKVKLRAFKNEDLNLVHQYMNDYEVVRNLVDDHPYPTTKEKVTKDYNSDHFKPENGYIFAIESLEDGRFIGDCGVFNCKWMNRHCYIGLYIGDKDLWGQGYGTDTIMIITRFIFEQLNMNKIKLNVFAFNKRAIRAYEKCGFQIDGVLREELYREGTYHDVYTMSILRDDYEQLIKS